MTDTQWTIIASSVPPTILALSSFIASVRNGKKADVIHEAVNGINAARLKENKEASFAQGVKQEHDNPTPQKSA